MLTLAHKGNLYILSWLQMFYAGNNIVVSNHFAQSLTENVRFRFSASMQSNVTALDEWLQLLRKQDAL